MQTVLILATRANANSSHIRHQSKRKQFSYSPLGKKQTICLLATRAKTIRLFATRAKTNNSPSRHQSEYKLSSPTPHQRKYKHSSPLEQIRQQSKYRVRLLATRANTNTAPLLVTRADTEFAYSPAEQIHSSPSRPQSKNTFRQLVTRENTQFAFSPPEQIHCCSHGRIRPLWSDYSLEYFCCVSGCWHMNMNKHWN